LDFEHKIKARAHKGDMRIGKTPKKLVSICCPQCRETKADTLKATEALNPATFLKGEAGSRST
jgi:hypothetical protein